MVAKKNMDRKAKGFAKATATGKVAGWKALVLENELLKVTVLPEYGGWIWSAFYKPREVELLWRSPRGLLHKDDPPVVPESHLGFRAYSPGGWPELFPHGSGAAEIRGVKMPFHGEVVNRRWNVEILRSPKGEAAARMWVDCHLLPLRLERILRVVSGAATLVMEETVTNRSGIPIDFMWGHHPYFGKPILSETTRIVAPAVPWMTTASRAAGRCATEKIFLFVRKKGPGPGRCSIYLIFQAAGMRW